MTSQPQRRAHITFKKGEQVKADDDGGTPATKYSKNDSSETRDPPGAGEQRQPLALAKSDVQDRSFGDDVSVRNQTCGASYDRSEFEAINVPPTAQEMSPPSIMAQMTPPAIAEEPVTLTYSSAPRPYPPPMTEIPSIPRVNTTGLNQTIPQPDKDGTYRPQQGKKRYRSLSSLASATVSTPTSGQARTTTDQTSSQHCPSSHIKPSFSDPPKVGVPASMTSTPAYNALGSMCLPRMADHQTQHILSTNPICPPNAYSSATDTVSRPYQIIPAGCPYNGSASRQCASSLASSFPQALPMLLPNQQPSVLYLPTALGPQPVGLYINQMPFDQSYQHSHPYYIQSLPGAGDHPTVSVPTMSTAAPGYFYPNGMPCYGPSPNLGYFSGAQTYPQRYPDGSQLTAELIRYFDYLQWHAKVTQGLESRQWELQQLAAWNQSQQGPSGAPSICHPSSESLNLAASLHTGGTATNGPRNPAHAHQAIGQQAHREDSEDIVIVL